MFRYFQRRRRTRLRALAWPASWLEIVQKNAPIYGRLPENDQVELRGLARVFLAEKTFEGCGGLELTDAIKLTIAVQACVLLLRRETDVFPGLTTILVYPRAFAAPSVEPIGGGLILEGEQVRLGEAWKSGVVVLSWQTLLDEAAGKCFGQNLVLHEFAHLLDMEDGAFDGTPPLEKTADYPAWRSIFTDEYEQLRRDSALGRYSVLDPYGASSPAEFFSVATECCFEKSTILRKRHPALYQELARFYHQDPAAWTAAAPGAPHPN